MAIIFISKNTIQPTKSQDKNIYLRRNILIKHPRNYKKGEETGQSFSFSQQVTINSYIDTFTSLPRSDRIAVRL